MAKEKGLTTKRKAKKAARKAEKKFGAGGFCRKERTKTGVKTVCGPKPKGRGYQGKKVTPKKKPKLPSRPKF